MTRLYTEQEVGELLRRASELQGEASTSTDRGLTLAEIETLAAEMGIEIGQLRQAASDLESARDASSRFELLGGPFRIDLRRVVDGELTDERWEQAVLEIRDATGKHGRVGGFGKTREWGWSFDAGTMTTRVSLSPRDDRTTIRVSAGHFPMALFAYLATVFLSGTVAGIALDGSGLAAPAVFATWGACVFAACVGLRAGLSRWSRRRLGKMRELLDRVQEVVTSSATADHDGLATGDAAELEQAAELPDPSSRQVSERRPTTRRRARS
ncbi:MAG: hypothetical protein AAF533_00205 [Acidobacteriota bacterium]